METNVPTCEIVTIGTELLLGQIEDTNTTLLSRLLRERGVVVRFRTTTGDRLEDIRRVLQEAVARADMVITTGGLGPTEDDLTRQAVAGAAGVELEFRPELMAQIGEIFRRAGYSMPENNRRQAFVPAGSQAIPNPKGTAPAFITLIRDRPIIALPGVPRELRYLMSEAVLPWITQKFRLGEGVILYRSVKVVGLGESGVDDLIGDLMREGKNPEVGLLASPGEITVRMAARGERREEALNLISPVEEELRRRLGEKIYGFDGDTLEGVVAEILERGGLSLAVVETFTGGLAALRLHRVPTRHLRGNLVIQTRETFTDWLGTLDAPWDQATAIGAARQIREEFRADVGLACLGFMEREGEIHQVECLASAVGDGLAKDFHWQMGGDIPMLQQRGSVVCLNTLRLALLGAHR